jgi:hypothetical protein
VDEPSSSGVHDGLAGSLAEGIVKVGTVVLSQVITDERLATVLVDTLENLTERNCESPARKVPRNLFHAPCNQRHIRDRGRAR